jgi:hypothetical protein
MDLTSIVEKDISFLSETLILHFLTQAGIHTDQAISGGWYLLLSNSLLIAAGQEVDKRVAMWRSGLGKKETRCAELLASSPRRRLRLGCLKGYGASNIAGMIRRVLPP